MSAKHTRGFARRFGRGRLRLNRLEAFSDGVFAIIVTLLVLELKVPELHGDRGVGALWQALLGSFPKLLSWLISFVIVCKFWLNHHHVLDLAAHADYGLVWLNSLFLMFQSFVPFPTALMGEYATNPLAVSLFGIVMAFNTVLFIALHAYVVRRLARRDAAATEPRDVVRRSLVGPAGYLLGALLAWIWVPLGFALYVVTPLAFVTPLGPRDPDVAR